MQSGQSYVIKAYRSIRTQNQPLVIYNCYFVQNFAFVFEQNGQVASQSVIQIVRNLESAFGTVQYDSIKVQRETTRINILRITFLTIINQFAEKVEIVYDTTGNRIVSYSLPNQRFAELPANILIAINSNSLSSLQSSSVVTSLTQTLTFLRTFSQFSGRFSVQLVLVRQVSQSYEFEFYIQTQVSGYCVRVLYGGGSQFFTTLFTIISTTQSLSQPLYVYSSIEGAVPASVDEIKATRGFQICEAVLMRGYSHYLVAASIREILINRAPNRITYNVIYNTANGVFLAILEFN